MGVRDGAEELPLLLIEPDMEPDVGENCSSCRMVCRRRLEFARADPPRVIEVG